VPFKIYPLRVLLYCGCPQRKIVLSVLALRTEGKSHGEIIDEFSDK